MRQEPTAETIRVGWSSTMQVLTRLAFFSLAVGFGAFVDGSDVNWGKKVPCFEMDGTVVCPGCNQRAGLSCPRSLRNSRDCLEQTTEKPYRYPQTTEPSTGKTDDYPTTTLPGITYENVNFTETTLPSSTISARPKEILFTSINYPIDVALYLYLLGKRIPRNRYVRQVGNVQDYETCNWNADCPCPLICCKTGPGCPKKCVIGIRLPPPWG